MFEVILNLLTDAVDQTSLDFVIIGHRYVCDGKYAVFVFPIQVTTVT
jgi:hypothetical protein